MVKHKNIDDATLEIISKGRDIVKFFDDKRGIWVYPKKKKKKCNQ